MDPHRQAESGLSLIRPVLSPFTKSDVALLYSRLFFYRNKQAINWSRPELGKIIRRIATTPKGRESVPNESHKSQHVAIRLFKKSKDS